MGTGFKGHEEHDVNGRAPNQYERSEANGATNEPDPSFIPYAERGADFDERNWGGHGYESRNGWYQRGTSGADIDTARYRQLGAQQDPYVSLQRHDETASRGLQLGALQRLQAAARGNAPSRAEYMAQAQADDALRQSAAGAAGARGPGASVAAMRGAMGGLSQRMGAVNGAAMDARAAEIAKDQAGYVNGANGMRQQDLTLATTQAQLQAQQNAINEARQQAYEKMAWDTRNADLQVQLERKAQDERQANIKRQQRDADEQQGWNTTRDAASAGLQVITSFTSDERAKTNVVPIGGLSRLRR